MHAFEMLRPGEPCWVELGERALAVLSTAQRATDTIAVAERLLATSMTSTQSAASRRMP
jgi:hypothetical protein